MNNDVSGFSVLLKFNVSRSLKNSYGLIYLSMGIILPVFIVSLLLFRGGTPTSMHIARAQGSTIGISNPKLYLVLTELPSILPMFAIIGSVGSTYLFSSDRSNGVYEYLIATRKIRIKDVFLSNVVSVTISVSIILVADLLIILSIVYLEAATILGDMSRLIVMVTIPLSYLCALLSMLAILTWASLSKRYVGVNSPGGIGVLLGVAPVLVYVLANNLGFVPATDIDLFGSLYSLGIFAVFIIFLAIVLRKISNESLLS